MPSVRRGARGLGGKKTEQPQTDPTRQTFTMILRCGARLTTSWPN